MTTAAPRPASHEVRGSLWTSCEPGLAAPEALPRCLLGSAGGLPGHPQRHALSVSLLRVRVPSGPLSPSESALGQGDHSSRKQERGHQATPGRLRGAASGGAGVPTERDAESRHGPCGLPAASFPSAPPPRIPETLAHRRHLPLPAFRPPWPRVLLGSRSAFWPREEACVGLRPASPLPRAWHDHPVWTCTLSSLAESSRPAALSLAWACLHLPSPQLPFLRPCAIHPRPPWSPHCERRDRSACFWAPGCPPWPRPTQEGPPGSSLTERACPRLPHACQWRDVFRAASCCACRAPTTAGRGPQVQKPLAPPELEAGAAALRPGGKPHLPTLLRGCTPNRRPSGS